MNKKLMILPALTALAAFARAADVRVGAWERGWVTNANAVVEQGTVAVAPEGTFDKAGAGDYALGIDRVLQPNVFELGVRTGTATVDFATAGEASVAAPAVLNEAFLWLDAERNVAANGSDVTAWNDSRETSVEGPYAHYGMTAPATAPQCVDRYGRKMVYFNGANSGAYMQVATASRTYQQVQTIRHAFFVVDFDKVYSYLMGGSGCHDMTIGSNGSSLSLDQVYFHPSENNSTAVFDARMYLNGERIDATLTKVRQGLQLVEFEFCGNSPRFSYFFNDNGAYKGGDYLGEVVFFTNTLSSAERLDMTAYLTRKWFGALSPSAASFAVADGATGVAAVPGGVTAIAGLSGKGCLVKSGAGALEVPNAQAEGLRGDVRVAEGTLTAEARFVPYAFADGERLTAESTSEDATTLATTANGLASGSAEKAGSGEIVVRALDPAISNLTVSSGTLTLTGADVAPDTVVAGTGVAAFIPNAGFEEFPAGRGDKEFLVNETAFGWTGENRYVRLARKDLMSSWMQGAASYVPYATPDGTVVMILENGGCAHTTISVPEDGDYELSFLTATRKGMTWVEGCPIDVELIREGVTNKVAHFQAFLDTGFHRHSHLVRGLQAGEYIFRFANTEAGVEGADGNTNIDDIRMVKVTRQETRAVFPVPNGDFERTDFSYDNATKFTSSQTPAAWTLTQGGGHSGENPDVGAVFWRSKKLYNHASSRYGNVQLFFASNGGTATTAAFTPPAGTWRLRCRGGRWGFGDGGVWQGNDLKANPSVSASVSVAGGAAVALGSIAVAHNVFQTLEFPTSFEVDGQTPVTLSIGQTVAMAGLLADDFELVAADADELVANGGFEADESWTFTSSSGKNAQRYNYGISSSWMGSARYEGAYYLYLDTGVATQTVTFPEDGLYRLTLHLAGRGDNSYYRGSSIRVWWNDGTDDHEIVTTPKVNGAEFRAYTALFRMPKGSYPVSFTGLLADKTIMVDGVSIRKAADEADAPMLGESLSLTVANGARVRLDYSGTVTLREFRVNGRRASGIINADRFPESLSGPGAIHVEPKGMEVIVR